MNKVCSVEDCSRPTIARGWCYMHWKRWSRHSDTAPTRASHGQTGTSEHRIWRGLKSRCFNKNSQDYPYYGGRGITVYAGWLGVDGFSKFLEDVGKRPTPLHTIDRKDNNGNYEPGNVEWSTRLAQANNTRQNHILEYKGRKLTIAEWAREVGMRRDTLKSRIYRGWSVEKALKVKVRKVMV